VVSGFPQADGVPRAFERGTVGDASSILSILKIPRVYPPHPTTIL
jgi:hypothetical protein